MNLGSFCEGKTWDDMEKNMCVILSSLEEGQDKILQIDIAVAKAINMLVRKRTVLSL